MHTNRIAIVDDHQGTIDGYMYRLGMSPEVTVVATGLFGEELESILAEHSIDVLLLDLSLPVSPSNPNPYPILQKLPDLIQRVPDVHIVVISMFSQPSLIKALMKIGIKGYILKDDSQAIINLAKIVTTISLGGYFFSESIEHIFTDQVRESVITDRQRQALEMCVAYPDLSSTALAEKMGVADSTFRNLLSGAYGRLGVRTRTAAIARARQLEILPNLNETKLQGS